MIKEKAFAKINLYLDVIEKRSDQYHNLETVMAPIDLYDVLTFSQNPIGDIVITSNKEITEHMEDNIVYKVARYILETYEISDGVIIHIDKHIPIAAGLAGGSADAAATLRGLNRLFKLKLTKEKLAEIAEQFGSDVPYCVYNQLCIARGKGEQLFFLKRRLKCPLLIITPAIEVSTKDIYQSLDVNALPKRKITGMTNAIYNKNYELLARELYNVLESVTFKKFPEVAKLSEEIKQASVDAFLMSGTGPAFFVCLKDKKRMKELEQYFSEKHFTKLTKIKL